ncbi:MAG: ATP-binding protein, partial [Microbacteriaceae bacterium]
MSSADTTAGDRTGAAPETVLAAVTALATFAPIILIDGPAGAGKSLFADALVARWPRRRAPALLRMDDLYPGWDGLAAGSLYLHSEVLAPLRLGAPAAWRGYDWASERRTEQRHPVDESRALIVEGCGTLTAANAALADI